LPATQSSGGYFAELLRPFDAANVRRRDTQALAVKLSRKMIDHHRQCGQMVGGDSESVVQRGRVMNVKRDELVGIGCGSRVGAICFIPGGNEAEIWRRSAGPSAGQ
jgi:hypothetical protein